VSEARMERDGNSICHDLLIFAAPGRHQKEPRTQ
jgi:hypothetical protein